MTSFVTEHINHIYPQLLSSVLYSSEVSPRGLKTREALGISILFTNPEANLLVSPGRNLNYSFMLAEWVNLLLGVNLLDVLLPYNSNMQHFSDDGRTLSGSYAPKLNMQWAYLLESLREPSTRQAVVTFWERNPRRSRDIPCTISLQFLLREGKLNLITTMRSNDLWWGFPYDIFNFTQLQRYVAMKLEVPVGWYLHQVGSLHLYEQHFDIAKEVAHNETVIWDPTSEPLTPMPQGFAACFLALSLMLKDQNYHVDPQGWINEVAPGMEQPWQDYLRVLAYKFTRNTDGMSDYWQCLVTHGLTQWPVTTPLPRTMVPHLRGNKDG